MLECNYKASSFMVLNSSLNSNQAARMGIKSDNRCAASVLQSPCCIDAAKKKNTGSKIPSDT
jgi:hypothetical protein